MKTPTSPSRRDFLTTLAACAAGTLVAGNAVTAAETSTPTQPAKRKGRLKQGICLGVFRGLKLSNDEICRTAAEAGAVGIDLVGPSMFPSLKKYGLVPTMLPGGSKIKAGINDPKHHTEIDGLMRTAIKDAASVGAPNVIALAGDRGTFTDEQSMDNCAKFLNGIKGQAEDAGVTICMELLNSKVNHPGYVCDRTAWGVELCKRVNSPRFKLLYDIYHMQIMEGDIIRTITANISYFGHLHTAGNPGRHEFDETQELNYVGICKAIADLGFTGILAHEYTPTKDPIGTLHRMMQICDV